MTERAIQFGKGGRLSGVFTDAREGKSRLCVGLVNSGLMPRSGPYRVYTQLARALAPHGISTLRFDLGGLGDSGTRSEGRLLDRTREEIGEAVQTMVTLAPESELALGGICSGAEDSFRYAASDARVTRTVLVDPFAYRTAGWGWRHMRHRLYRRALRAAGLWRPMPGSGDAELIDYQYMPREEASRLLAGQVARGSAVHFVYTSGRHELFNHAAQLAKMFPALNLGTRTTVDFLPEIGHTQMLQAERDLLISTIVRRLTDPSTSPHPR